MQFLQPQNYFRYVSSTKVCKIKASLLTSHLNAEQMTSSFMKVEEKKHENLSRFQGRYTNVNPNISAQAVEKPTFILLF